MVVAIENISGSVSPVLWRLTYPAILVKLTVIAIIEVVLTNLPSPRLI